VDFAAALIVAITLSMVTSVNVGVVSLALAWLVGVYLGGVPLAGDRQLPHRPPPQLLGAPLRHGQPERNPRPNRGARRARMPWQPGVIPIYCSSSLTVSIG
jgi:hypothetical protein